MSDLQKVKSIYTLYFYKKNILGIITFLIFFGLIFFIRNLVFGNENIIFIPEAISLKIIGWCWSITRILSLTNLKGFSLFSCFFIAFCFFSLLFFFYLKYIKFFFKNVFLLSLYFLIYIFGEWTLRSLIYLNIGSIIFYLNRSSLLLKDVYAFGQDWLDSLFFIFYDGNKYNFKFEPFQFDIISIFFIVLIIFLIKYAVKIKWKNLLFYSPPTFKNNLNNNYNDFYLYVFLSSFLLIFSNYFFSKPIHGEIRWIFFFTSFFSLYGEEIIFRNFVLRILSLKTPFPIANIIHSCLFVSSHFLSNVKNFYPIFLGNFLVSIFLGIIWKKYGVKYSFIAHYTTNGFVGILQIYQTF